MFIVSFFYWGWCMKTLCDKHARCEGNFDVSWAEEHHLQVVSSRWQTHQVWRQLVKAWAQILKVVLCLKLALADFHCRTRTLQLLANFRKALVQGKQWWSSWDRKTSHLKIASIILCFFEEDVFVGLLESTSNESAFVELWITGPRLIKFILKKFRNIGLCLLPWMPYPEAAHWTAIERLSLVKPGGYFHCKLTIRITPSVWPQCRWNAL